jgi:seryl-tRNA synthetase
MLDINYIIKNYKKIEEAAVNKNFNIDIQKIISLYNDQKQLVKQVDELRTKRNNIAKDIPKLSGEEKKEKINMGKEVKYRLSSIEPKLEKLKLRLEQLMLQVPSVPLENVPVGKDDNDNIEVKKWGLAKNFDFKPKDHVKLGEILNIIDIPKGVKIAGTKNYFLKNEACLLEWAVCQYALNYLVEKGFSPLTVPLMVKEEAMIGTGYFPGGEEQTYTIEKDKLYLIGTSEVSSCSYYKDEILNEKELPIRLVSLSNCFRREAGTYGKDTHGLYRIHQFQKVEQVIICKNDPEESKKLHKELLENAENLLQSLNLPYRVVNVCTGDLGMGQVFKNDIETWMPSRKSYGETHSCSMFHDFQARRLNIKYKDENGKLQYAHTLNNTCVASPRILIPILENFQNRDNSIDIPKPLQPYLNGLKQIKPKN